MGDVSTLQGESAMVTIGDSVKVQSATVTTPDVDTTNGVIHIIDAVITPPSLDVGAFLATCSTDEETTDETAPTSDIPTTAVQAGVFTTLVAALDKAELVDTLAGEGPFTVFAPTDDAFATLPAELVPCLLLPGNKAALTDILLYHVASGKVMSSNLSDGMDVSTLQGEAAMVTIGDSVKVQSATVTTPDVDTTNGVIHIIDAVITPPSLDVGAFLATCSTDEETETMEESAGSKLSLGVFAVVVSFMGAINFF